MRFVGAAIFLTSSGLVAYATREMFRRRRPLDLVFALAAPLFALIALAGLLLVFVPTFF